MQNDVEVEEPLFFFFGHQPPKDGKVGRQVFSQWWPCTFRDAGRDIRFNCAEQYMMYGKAELFKDPDAMRGGGAILATSDPKRLKALGRRVRNYDERTWRANREAIVTRGKCAQVWTESGAARLFALDR
jgi:ribA/ribD-fused uncharacterized protein